MVDDLPRRKKRNGIGKQGQGCSLFFFPSLQMAHRSLLFPGKNPFFLVMKMLWTTEQEWYSISILVSVCLSACLSVNDDGKKRDPLSFIASLSLASSFPSSLRLAFSLSLSLSLRRLDAQHMKPVDRPLSCIGLLPKWSLPVDKLTIRGNKKTDRERREGERKRGGILWPDVHPTCNKQHFPTPPPNHEHNEHNVFFFFFPSSLFTARQSWVPKKYKMLLMSR